MAWPSGAGDVGGVPRVTAATGSMTVVVVVLVLRVSA